MAIKLLNNKYNLVIDSNMIIGVMGNDYESFLLSLSSDDIYYLDKRISVSNKKVYSLFSIDDMKVQDFLIEFNLKEDFLNKRINNLSHSEQKLLKYLLLTISDKKIIVIDEPFIDLDYNNKKKVITLLNREIKNKKTIIIGSVNSNIIYSICEKVLLINKKSIYYGDISVFHDKKELRKYHVDMPDIVKFITLAKNKKVELKYTSDIRELIKDVYRNVSQK